MAVPRKVLVIGLDSAEPSLVFDRWRAELPCLAALMDQGLYGPLRSTVPPITVPAWAAMLTSKDPGQLGLYGLRNRRDYSYEPLCVVGSSALREPTLDQVLSRRGLTSILLGVPPSYPPRPLNGIRVSCFLTPNKDVSYTYPPEFRAELERAAGGEYIFDVENFRTLPKDRLREQVYAMTEARFAAAEDLLTRKPWDFFMMVEMGPDRLQHAFWRYQAPDHRLFVPGHRYASVIRDYYRRLDALVGRLVDQAPAGTLVLVVSDHGARSMVGGFALNQWLMAHGYLTLRKTPARPVPLSPDLIDWSRTLAWGEGGYYGRVFLNVAGREPEGQVPKEEAERVCGEIKAGLEAAEDEQGRPLGHRVFRPEEIYRQVRGVAPDLMVYLGDLAWRSVGSVGAGQPLCTLESDTGPDEANHAPEGLLVMARKGAGPGQPSGPRAGLSVYDLAPTVLDYLGLEVPGDMIGRVVA